jgi:hypothetical protein
VLAFRWTLSQPIITAIPPGNHDWFHLAMDMAHSFQPITDDETTRLLAHASGAVLHFQIGNN